MLLLVVPWVLPLMLWHQLLWLQRCTVTELVVVVRPVLLPAAAAAAAALLLLFQRCAAAGRGTHVLVQVISDAPSTAAAAAL